MVHVAVSLQRTEVFSVGVGLLDDLTSGLLNFGNVFIFGLDQGGQQALELVDDSCRVLKITERLRCATIYKVLQGKGDPSYN